jgi:hypothetical protein
MSSGISSKTPHYGFNLVSFDYPRWGSFEHENWQLVDAVLQASLVSPAGMWRNSTAYPLGARVVDSQNYRTYAAAAAHTSSATGTFAEERVAFPARWTEVLNAPVYRGLWTPATAYNYLDVISLPTGEFYIATTAHTSGGTFSPSNWVQTGAASSTWGTITGKPAEVRLKFVNTTTIRLDGIKTGKLSVGGVDRPVPATGPTLPATGLTVATLYYIYAYWTGTAVALEASTTTHITHTDGIEVKSGDPTRTLVGMGMPVTGALWSFSGKAYLVRSYYNRAPVAANQPFGGTYAGMVSTTAIELGGGVEQIRFLAWDDEAALVVLSAQVFNSTANTITYVQSWLVNTVLAANTIGPLIGGSSPVVSGSVGLSSAAAMRCSEGLHYATVFGAVAAGVGTYGSTSGQALYVG